MCITEIWSCLTICVCSKNGRVVLSMSPLCRFPLPNQIWTIFLAHRVVQNTQFYNPVGGANVVFFQVLPHDSKARRIFVTSGGLKKVQEIKAEPGSILHEYINTINNCFPEEIVRYYSPGYSEALLERVEKFVPTAWNWFDFSCNDR